MKRRGRRGFFLIWAELAVCIVMLLAGSVMAASAGAARYWQMMRESADAVLLAEEMVETMKYNRRFGKDIFIPTEAMRNGRTYQIETVIEAEQKEEILMDTAICTVTAPSGERISFRTFIGAHEILP